MRDNRFRSFYSLNVYLSSFENNIPDGRLIVLSSWNLAPKRIEHFLPVHKFLSLSRYIPPESVKATNKFGFESFVYNFTMSKGK